MHVRIVTALRRTRSMSRGTKTITRSTLRRPRAARSAFCHPVALGSYRATDRPRRSRALRLTATRRTTHLTATRRTIDWHRYKRIIDHNAELGVSHIVFAPTNSDLQNGDFFDGDGASQGLSRGVGLVGGHTPHANPIWGWREC